MKADNPRGQRGLRGLVVASRLICLGPAAAARAGQTLPDFEAAVNASFAAQGDRIGHALRPYALDLSFAASGTTYLGRASSKRADVLIVLVSAKAGRVSRWSSFALPGFEGLFTHGTTRRRGPLLEVAHGRTVQHYR